MSCALICFLNNKNPFLEIVNVLVPGSVSSQVEKIRQVKAKSLYLQVEKLHQSLTKLDSTIAAVSQVLDEGRHLDVLLARERMLTQIHELKALRGLLQAQEDDRFMFTPPDQVAHLLSNKVQHNMTTSSER